MRFNTEEYETLVPIIHDARFEIGDMVYRSPDVEGCSFVRGHIGSHAGISETITPSASLLSNHMSIISSNPNCEAASPYKFFEIPAIAVAKNVLEAIKQSAKNGKPQFQGRVEVEPKSHIGRNILIGNVDNPKNICITHYDSISIGAHDNASGVAVVQHAVAQIRGNMDETLFALCGTEELSYDEGVYWGSGYRALEQSMPHLFEKSEKIIVIDSVGNTMPQLQTEKDPKEDYRYGALPLENFESLRKKISLIIGDVDGPNGLLSLYHSKDDDGRNLSEEHLRATVELLVSELS